MPLLLALFIASFLASIVALVRVRRAAARRLSAALQEYQQSAGLLLESKTAHGRLQEQTRNLDRTLQQTAAELARTVDAKSNVEQTARLNDTKLNSKLKLTEHNLSVARDQTKQLEERERQAFAERDAAHRQAAEANRARQLAEEEARQSRTAKDSFAIEVKLLREQLQRTLAVQAEASVEGEAPLAVAPKATNAAKPPSLVTVSTWWCIACNCGGTKPHKCISG